jgi:hypothetical protein
VEQGPPESGRGAPKVLIRGSDLEGGRRRRAVPMRRISGRIPRKTWGPCSTSTAAPLAGCDRGADHGRVEWMPIPRASSGSDPQRGPSSALRRAPCGLWDCDQGGRVDALSRGPAFGDATAETRKAADSTVLDSWRKPFGGCAREADAMPQISLCPFRGLRVRTDGVGAREVRFSSHGRRSTRARVPTSTLSCDENCVLPANIGRIRGCQHRLIRAVASWPLIRMQ